MSLNSLFFWAALEGIPDGAAHGGPGAAGGRPSCEGHEQHVRAGAGDDAQDAARVAGLPGAPHAAVPGDPDPQGVRPGPVLPAHHAARPHLAALPGEDVLGLSLAGQC